MKNLFGFLFATLILAGSVGCHHNLACNNCNNHNGGHVARLPKGHHMGHHHQAQTGPAGPPTAAYAYPYYTTRAPRDFLLDNPPSIGY